MSGSGFASGLVGTLDVQFEDAAGVMSNQPGASATVVALGPGGSFTARLIVPTLAPGLYTIDASGPAGDVGAANFEVTAMTLTTTCAHCHPPLSAGVAVAYGLPGSSVALSATGYTSSSPITVKVGSSVVANLTSGSDGSFSTTFTIPSDVSLGPSSIAPPMGSAAATDCPSRSPGR